MVNGDVADHGGVVHLALLGQAQVEPSVGYGLVKVVLVIVVSQLSIVRRYGLFETNFVLIALAATFEKIIEISRFLVQMPGNFLRQNTRLRLAI